MPQRFTTVCTPRRQNDLDGIGDQVHDLYLDSKHVHGHFKSGIDNTVTKFRDRKMSCMFSSLVPPQNAIRLFKFIDPP
ncbi:hypothetical protein CBR_g18991 [Chara braunii]|uniref:Uncharacterized protein n=1 Tax=Chara braunii TaxID=69332 RepID=A0A388KX80_CHABU|nr:hypothetical protein CBR_g18991 [Chara braunii]|eukprot:GBG74582.1 hypothetical protein CBR_g18991 [Chara braunii]